jgi:tryptophan halogenase
MESRQIRNITILGGGTAGWLTALYVKTVLPTKTITLVESDSIGILGAGEGSTPQLINILDACQIPVSEVIRKTGATFKQGIKFTNWTGGGENDFYYHPFGAYGNIGASEVNLERLVTGSVSTFAFAAKTGDPQTEWCFNSKTSEQNKLGFKRWNDGENYSADNPIYQFEKMTAFSLHFNARELAALLSEIGQERGIKRVEGIVASHTKDDNGFVTAMTLEDGTEIKTDFVFDASGLRSYFAKADDAKWISAKEYLTVDSAMPFFLDMESPIPPHTESIAMKYGWIWKIPLQERYGCGYVFNSEFISDEEAREEIVEWLGYEPEWPREKSFKWEPGYLEEHWRKNVFSVGLASGFVEPLEATSIWTTVIQSLSRVLGNVELLYTCDPEVQDQINAYFRGAQEEVVGFLYTHYMGGRTDTDFWKHYTYENAPQVTKRWLDIAKKRAFSPEDAVGHYQFDIDSWSYILLGLKNKDFIEAHKLHEFYSFVRSFSSQRYESFKKRIDNIATFEALPHEEVLEALLEEK